MGLSALLKWDPSGDPANLGGTGTWDYLNTTAWDDNGSAPNVAWTDVKGLDVASFNGTGALVHLGAPITANGLTFNTTGYTIDNNGSALNTLSLVTSAVAGPAPIITMGANNVAATISASILGNDGLQFTAGAFTSTTTTLSGDNKFIGGVTINSGTVSLAANSPGALNQSIRNTLSFGTLASALRLNGNSISVRDLSGTTNLSTITNGLVSTNAILTVYQQNDKVVKTVLADGSGTLELVKDGPATLTLGSNNTYSGATTVRGSVLRGSPDTLSGTLELAGNNVGGLTATSAVNLSDDGILRLTNTSTANSIDRLNDAAPINLRGGTLAFSNDGSSASFSENAGVVNVLAGTNNLFADVAAAGKTSAINFTSLSRAVNAGSVITFQSQSQGTTVPGQLGFNAQDRIVFATAPTLNDNMIGGWALFDTSDFATYNTTTVTSVKMVTYAQDLDQSLWTTTTNVKVNNAGTVALTDPTFTGIRTVNSLNLATEPVTIDLTGLTLNIDTGGLICQASTPFGGTITNGFLTAGTANGAELVITVPNAGGALTLDSSASIINNGVNGVNAVSLVKAGAGTLILSAQNAYTGSTSVVGGTLQIDADSYLGGGSGATTLRLYDGTLAVTTSMTLNVRRSIEVGGNSFISIAAGTTNSGQIFTYNGSISSLANTEGSLSFLSNATEASSNADPGKVVAALNAPLLLGGSLRIDATTAAGTATGIFRTSSNAASVIGRSLQIGMNGTAIFTQTGSTLSVGSGIDDTLDVGVKDLNTFSSVAKVGTLNLTVPVTGAATQFTAKVDRVRIGVQTQTSETVANNTAGTVVLATNNDISAGTDITISDNANSSGSTLTASTLTLGTGTNNVTTQSFTIGGRKGTATVALPAGGGTFNLKGFAERTLNLNLGRIDDPNGSSGSSSTGTLNAATGTFTGSFDTIVLGEKTGSTVAGGATGTMTLGAFTNSVVANALMLGVDSGFNGTTTSTTAGAGTLTLGGGSFTVYNDVALGTQANKGTARGTLTITGGTFAIGGNITKTNSDLSNGVVTVNGATAVLDMHNALVGDTTNGTITASELIFRAGAINFTSAITLDGRDVAISSALVPLTDALIVRDVSIAAPVTLTGSVADKGGVHYEAAGNGAGATLASVALGTVARTFNVEDSTAAPADLTVSGAVTGTGLLTKKGAGTVLLNGAVAGATTIVAGELAGSGNIAGAVNVSLDPTIGVVTKGTLGAGGAGSIGTLKTGPLTFAPTVTVDQGGGNVVTLTPALQVDLNSTARTSDKVVVNGGLTLAADNKTVLNLSDLNPIGTYSFFALPIVDYSTWNGGLFTVGGVVIDDYDSANPTASTKFSVGSNGYALDYNYNDNGVPSVALISVPEPGSLALFAGGVALLGGMRRRRR